MDQHLPQPALVIFDCDGVLIESEPLAVKIEAAELTKLGWPITEAEVIERFVGRSEQFICDQIAGRLGPDVFLYAAARLGADPSSCVVVEDSRHGVEAGRAAGMHVFAYAGGLTPAERLRGPGTTVFADMRDLPQLIATLGARSS